VHLTSIDRRLSLVLVKLAAFLVAVVVVIIQALTGWYLGVAIIGAMVVSTPLAWHETQIYWRRERGLRFGPRR
jgi:O-antigen ligase